MTAAQRAKYEARLRELVAELTTRGPQKIEPNRTSEFEPSDQEDEQPLNEMLSAIASGRNRAFELELQQVHHALQKLREEPDDFGLCEDCEEPIAKARLEAKPQAALCVACQGRRDQPRGGARKKITDYR
jgi:DnaK suppressor protein